MSRMITPHSLNRRLLTFSRRFFLGLTMLALAIFAGEMPANDLDNAATRDLPPSLQKTVGHGRNVAGAGHRRLWQGI